MPGTGWFVERAAFVKGLDTHHLLPTGAEGFTMAPGATSMPTPPPRSHLSQVCRKSILAQPHGWGSAKI